MNINPTKNKRIVMLFLILYFLINLLYLTRFPFVHSDESWLSGLSRNILESRSPSVTETFFDLYERHPHAIKILFHLIQICFLKVFGYSIFSFRLISLIFGTITLFFFYKLCRLIINSEKFALLTAFLLAVDIQFIYASHFARQEIIILFSLILGLYFFYKYTGIRNYYRDIIIGIIIGSSIGIHPNSFIIFIPFIFLYGQHIHLKKLKVINCLIYFLMVSLFALFFILLSFKFDPNFISNYMNYGNQFGVLNSIISKISQTKEFYLKLYYGISGTYYTPNIKFQFYLFTLVFLTALLKLIFLKNSDKKEVLASIVLIILAINVGILIIGRFNATSIVFLFPPFYILTALILKDIKYLKSVYTPLISVILIASAINIYPYLNASYDSYLNEIGSAVKRDAKVLANLNCEYYFENGKLYDYRNLTFLNEHNMTFSDYIYDHNIKYIIYSDEMDFIYGSRPVWNGIYGNLFFYYDDMQKFLDNKCTLVHKFKNNVYGIRITRYINTRDWWIKIYKVKE